MPPPASWTVEAYLEPDVGSGRLQRGQLVTAMREIDVSSGRRAWRLSQRGSWAQVAAPGRSLDEPLTERDIQRPFRLIGAPREDDILGLVDFIRTSPEHPYAPGAGSGSIPPLASRVAGHWPMDRVDWRSDRMVEVRLLESHHAGQLAVLRRSGQVWEVVRLSYWISG